MRATNRERERAQWIRILEFIGMAVIVHLAVVPFLGFLIPEAGDPPDKKTIRVVSLISKGSALPRPSPKLKYEREDKKPPPPQEKVNDPERDPKGRIVDIPPSPDDTPPEEYDFVSEHNTRTERETVSRHRTPDYQNAMNELSRAETKQAAKEPKSTAAALEIGPSDPTDRDRDQSKSAKERVLQLPDIKQRDRLALKVDPEFGALRNQERAEALRGNSKRLRLSTGEDQPSQKSSAPRKGLAALDLMPDVGVLARLSGAPANDYTGDMDIEEGEGTFLNSREFKYASFFNRLKRGISQHWRPLPEYRRRDPTGKVYGHRDRVTVLDVTLKPDGSLEEVEVSRSSGLEFLDREAVSAFRRAQPFPNPPRGLVDDTGRIKFPFGFHIEFSRRGGLRLPF